MKRYTHSFAAALIILLVAALLAVCALSLTGCAPTLTEGRVVDKNYSPAYSSIALIPMFNGKTTTLLPVSQYHSESWTVSVQNDAGDRDTWSVDAALYEQVQVSDAVRLAEDGGVLFTKG